MDLVPVEKRKRGRPKGTAGRKLVNGLRAWVTATKMQQRDAIRQEVSKHASKMIQAQIAHACGIGHLFTRDKTGKFTRIEDMHVAERLLAEGTEGVDYWIFVKDPSVQAFSDLFDRAFDKPAQPAQDVKHEGTLTIRIEKPW